jgi:hypothetical protein
LVGAGARAGFGPPEAVGSFDGTGAALAIDPASGVAIAVWQAAHGIAYAQRPPGP